MSENENLRMEALFDALEACDRKVESYRRTAGHASKVLAIVVAAVGGRVEVPEDLILNPPDPAEVETFLMTETGQVVVRLAAPKDPS